MGKMHCSVGGLSSKGVGAMPEKSLLFIHALTSLHPGSGTALGAVDMPVQRERHTNWPIIPGSALKGVIRDACRENALESHEADENRSRRRVANEEDAELIAAFGPGKIVGEGDSHAGALSFTDARLLAYPVRSIKGVFAWVTCPAVLERFNRDLRLAGRAPLAGIPTPAHSKACCAAKSPLLIGSDLVLEEFDFQHVGDADSVATAIADFVAVDDADMHESMMKRLVVLNDDDFGHFAHYATEVLARIGLDYDTKTVKGGALFYEEFLPPETIFYSVVIASESRFRRVKAGAAEILAYLAKNLPEYLQIGADETIGKGICAVRLANGQEA